MLRTKTFCLFPLLSIGIVTLVTASPANANRPEPVPLYGTYDMFLDRSKQTFNGKPVPTSLPYKQQENFTTTCDGSGCIARSINKRPPPASFDYQWVNGRWESSGDKRQYIVCNDGSKVPSTKFDVIKSKGDGSFFGERTITVTGGCPGFGAGTYWLPFTLTPV